MHVNLNADLPPFLSKGISEDVAKSKFAPKIKRL